MKLADDQNQEDSKKNTNIRFIIHIICIVGFLSCAAWLVWYLFSIFRNNYLMEELRENYVTELTPSPMYIQPTDSPDPTPEPNLFGDREYPDFKGLDVPELVLDFDGLQELCPDIYAWIYVPDTVIDYPVVQRAGDADYYLRRDLQGNRLTAGTLFTQYYNHKDWLDNLTIIYGHNMHDGSMFASLHYYEDSQFFEEHPYIYIYTPEYTLVYEVFAAHEYSNTHLLLNFTMNDHSTFAQYLEQILSLNGIHDNINHDLDVTADDRVLVLSTCMSSDRNEYRYLVQAKLAAVEKTAQSLEGTENGELSGRTGIGEE